MYDTESNMYGSGRNISSFIDNDVRDPMTKAQAVRDEEAHLAEVKRDRSGGGGCF